MKSRVVRHGIRFLRRIFKERFRGVRPEPLPAELTGDASSHVHSTGIPVELRSEGMRKRV